MIIQFRELHPRLGITDQIYEWCLYTIPAVSTTRFRAAFPKGV
jgi:hypothetical protein